jgi:hypothetical protein
MKSFILFLPIACAGVSFIVFVSGGAPNWPDDILIIARVVDLLIFAAAASAGVAVLTVIRY